MMRSRIFERKGGRVIGRNDEGEEGLDIFGRGKTIDCFQVEGNISLVKHEFSMKSKGLRHPGIERRSMLLEKSKGPEDVSLMFLRSLYRSVKLIVEKWSLFSVIG